VSTLLFWEKPGCAGNARQKSLLREAGHRLEVRSLLDEPWTAERLSGFFGDLPLSAWFNGSAPKVKSGEVDPARLDREQALALMLAEPLLIRRPLMQREDGERMVGFDSERVAAWIGLASDAEAVGEGCAAASVACPVQEGPS